MLLKNSIKQILRSKQKTIAFILLLILVTTFLSLGINLWKTSSINLKAYEKFFTTIGVITQKENTLKVVSTWDSAYQQYFYVDEPVYDSILPVSVLDFPGANYIIPPKRRPYYGAYTPDLQIYSEDEVEGKTVACGSIVEFMPYQDCNPSEPVKVKIVKSLWGYRKEGDVVWLCDEFNDQSSQLQEGNTYISRIINIQNLFGDSQYDQLPFTVPFNPIETTQRDHDGGFIVKQNMKKNNWDEVTTEFWNSDEGRKWNEVVKAYDRFFTHTIPVIPTDKTELLMEFHQKSSTVSQGRDISEDEYETGAKVCLIPQNLAGRNKLSVGEMINLQLYFANYKDSASLNFGSGAGFNYSLLNAKGNAYPVFENTEYKIVGIYSGYSKTSYPTGYELGENAVIVPYNSVKNIDENNIVDYGPMKGYTTSFQIPNGSISSYMKKFEALSINNLEITFYDGGYSNLADGMQNLKLISIILVLASGIATFAILIFFLYLFIGKQKKRTAIERSLGMSKWSCIGSYLYGILTVTAISDIIGSISGMLINRYILFTTDKSVEHIYSATFSNWVNNSDKSIKIVGANGSIGPLTSVIVAICIIIFTAVIAIFYIWYNLKAEPLALLSNNEEE